MFDAKIRLKIKTKTYNVVEKFVSNTQILVRSEDTTRITGAFCENVM